MRLLPLQVPAWEANLKNAFGHIGPNPKPYEVGEEKETETLCVPLLGRATASVPALPVPGLGISLYCSSLVHHTPQATECPFLPL